MSGFMSAYEGTFRVTIEHPDKEYWVDLRKHLTHGATEKSAEALQALEMVGGKPKPTPNVFKSRAELVLASIVDWNLDDANGTIWPINMQSIRRLPDAVFSQLHNAIEESNKPPTAQERAQFPGEGLGGDPDGGERPGEPVDVPVGAGAVEAPRPQA